MSDEPTLADIDEALGETAKTLRLPLTAKQRVIVADFADDLLDQRLELCAAAR